MKKRKPNDKVLQIREGEKEEGGGDGQGKGRKRRKNRRSEEGKRKYRQPIKMGGTFLTGNNQERKGSGDEA